MRQLITVTNATQAELISERLMEEGAVSVALETMDDEALYQINPADMPLWQKTKLRAFFPAEIAVKPVAEKVFAELVEPLSYEIEEVADRDWVRETQQYFKPQCFGDDLWVIPSWTAPDMAGKIVRIDPGLAFGTGTHPTTAMCLEWLAHNPPSLQAVVDYGCGSGILSLACLAAGAKRVIAVDHDQQALQATHNNAQLNHFVTDDNLAITTSEKMMPVEVPLIIANILANPLIELAPELKKYASRSATLLLSGLLVTDIEKVAAAYAPEFCIESTKVTEGWALLVMRRTDS